MNLSPEAGRGGRSVNNVDVAVVVGSVAVMPARSVGHHALCSMSVADAASLTFVRRNSDEF